MIEEQLTRVFQSALPSSFKSLKVVSFKSGSIVTTVDVYFSSTPADLDDFLIASILMSAAVSITGFDIEGTSIYVNGITSSGQDKAGNIHSFGSGLSHSLGYKL
ncbi:hypothetical protein CgunFtcFv8_006435 [Champsocephalus gunnari]|uniref:SEA domain-containing protein n=1 Tax=Champsocephalus gunnari TaxID=52237 RepID=A0AAN8GZA9_CHAGU|nr:hypothetical protein CgunFtcFv8_006435 [Champsocephalus gunnari]